MEVCKSDDDLRTLLAGYVHARERVVQEGYGWEIDWQDRRTVDVVSEKEWLHEYAWVVLSSGMRATVVAQKFGRIREAFLGLTDAKRIADARAACEGAALKEFNHAGKIAAVGGFADMLSVIGIEGARGWLRREGLAALDQLPYIGPATRFHLAKNLGLDVAKPDRHLIRLARAAGCESPGELCRRVSEATGDRISTVDLVFWRFATLDRGYVGVFAREESPKQLRAAA